MLEQDRRGDQQPVWSEQGQAEKGNEERPQQIATAKGLPERPDDSLRLRE